MLSDRAAASHRAGRALGATLGLTLLLLLLGVSGAAFAPFDRWLVIELRVTRLAAAVVVGAALAIAGALLQAVLRNDLVEPGVIGVQAGGVLSATLLSLVLPSAAMTSPVAVALAAWAGALATCLAVYLLARGPSGFEPTQLLLTGVGVGGALGAITIVLVAATASSPFAQGVLLRQVGNLASIDARQLGLLVPATLVFGLAGWLLSRPLDTLALGEEAALGLGLPLGRTRLLALGVATGLSGLCVAVAGGLSFVGLLAPHIGRRLVGPGLRRRIPLAALLGATLVLAADLAGRTLPGRVELPAGLFVGVIGAPYLLYLLMKR